MTARKADDKSGAQVVGGLSAIRREMLNIIREEQEEKWQSLDYKGIQVRSARFRPNVTLIAVSRLSNP